MGLQASAAGLFYRHYYLPFTPFTFNPCCRFPESTHQPLHWLWDPHQPPAPLDPPRWPRTALQNHLQPCFWRRCSANSKSLAPLYVTGTGPEGHGDNFMPRGALLTPVRFTIRIARSQEYKNKSLPVTCWCVALWRGPPGVFALKIFVSIKAANNAAFSPPWTEVGNFWRQRGWG